MVPSVGSIIGVKLSHFRVVFGWHVGWGVDTRRVTIFAGKENWYLHLCDARSWCNMGWDRISLFLNFILVGKNSLSAETRLLIKIKKY